MTEKTKKMTEASASVCLILATALVFVAYRPTWLSLRAVTRNTCYG